MTKKRKDIPKESKQLSSAKVLIAISVIIIIVIAFTFVLSSDFLQTSEVPFSLNAAIIDQLGKDFPNPTFVENATSILKNHGFNVSYHNESLDVGFFRGLAKYNYGIIILRVHSALREDNSTVDLFTSEEFVDYKYRWELENGFLTVGEIQNTSGYASGKYYFVVTSRFIENLEGRFPKSIVIAMGCWSLKPGREQLANAFYGKGAKAYIGWTNAVLSQDTDDETLRLLKMLLNENNTIAEAIFRTHTYRYYQGDTLVLSRMDFYPDSAGNLKISDLISEAGTTSALTTSSIYEYTNFLILNASLCEKVRVPFIACNKIFTFT